MLGTHVLIQNVFAPHTKQLLVSGVDIGDFAFAVFYQHRRRRGFKNDVGQPQLLRCKGFRGLEVRDVGVRGDKPGDRALLVADRRLGNGKVARRTVFYRSRLGKSAHARRRDQLRLDFIYALPGFAHCLQCGPAEHCSGIAAKLAHMGGIDTHKPVLTILDRYRIRQRIEQRFRETQIVLQLLVRPFARGDVARDATVSGKAIIFVEDRIAVHADIDEFAVAAGIIELKIAKRRLRIQKLVVFNP